MAWKYRLVIVRSWDWNDDEMRDLESRDWKLVTMAAIPCTEVSGGVRCAILYRKDTS